jgi:hypothetical protein
MAKKRNKSNKIFLACENRLLKKAPHTTGDVKTCEHPTIMSPPPTYRPRGYAAPAEPIEGAKPDYSPALYPSLSTNDDDDDNDESSGAPAAASLAPGVVVMEPNYPATSSTAEGSAAGPTSSTPTRLYVPRGHAAPPKADADPEPVEVSVEPIAVSITTERSSWRKLLARWFAVRSLQTSLF